MRRKAQRLDDYNEDLSGEECTDLDDQQFKTALLKQRIVPLTEEITEERIGSIKGSLTELSVLSSEEDIFLFINCPGGDVEAGLALYDFITLFLKAPVIGIAGEQCASMALIVLQGCIKRVASPHSIFLLHPARAKATIVYWPGIKDRMQEIETLLAKEEQKSNNILKKHSKMSLSEIKKLSFANNGNGTILSAREALEKGFIDEIAEGDKYKIF